MREADFTKEYLADLNPLQLAAAKKVKGAVLLLAVPGSGKTTVLIKRLGYMIYAAGVNPRSILTMTYTVAATKEMRARFREYFGDEYADVLEFRTINGVCSKIIEWYSRNISRQAPFSLAESEGSLASLIGGIYRELNDEYAGESIIKDCRTAISYIKNMMLTPEEIGELETNITNLPEIYERYCAFLRSRRLMDYDDQMVYALAILRRYPEVLAHCREKFSYICVDEAQDTSKIQHEIIRLLAGESGNIFMVGDEDQSIYGFRAAYPDALMSFEKDYKNAEVMYLEENYRSSEEIIALASRFVSKNLYRRSKKLVPTQGAGKPVRIIGTQNRQGQFRYLFEVGKSPAGETAILFRNNDSAIPLIDFYERNGIGYNTRACDGAFFSSGGVNDIRDIIS
ncbi:MAG: ATP-dependent helicase, partial [Oscillospiraceae bacterium]|nr:ATP-dependent helicase [Oscillospiraceae bacterium]